MDFSASAIVTSQSVIPVGCVAPERMAYRPVSSAARETVHENSTLKLSSRMPCAAILSMFGVGTPRTPPYAPTSPQPRLSGKMRTTFGRWACWADSWVTTRATRGRGRTRAGRGRIIWSTPDGGGTAGPGPNHPIPAEHSRFRLPPADWLPGSLGLEGGWWRYREPTVDSEQAPPLVAPTLIGGPREVPAHSHHPLHRGDGRRLPHDRRGRSPARQLGGQAGREGNRAGRDQGAEAGHWITACRQKDIGEDRGHRHQRQDQPHQRSLRAHGGRGGGPARPVH